MEPKVDLVDLRDPDRLKSAVVTKVEMGSGRKSLESKNVGNWELSGLASFWEVLKKAPDLVGAAITIIKGVLMKDWKTTLAGVVAFLVMIAKWFGVEIPVGVSEAVVTICLFIGMFFAKDKAGSGG